MGSRREGPDLGSSDSPKRWRIGMLRKDYSRPVSLAKISGFDRIVTYFDASAASMAAVTSGESGVVLGSNRLMILPSRPMRNLPKFHLMSPGKGESFPASATYSGCRLGPFTSILSKRGKVTLYLVEQNCLISSFVPGSWPAN